MNFDQHVGGMADIPQWFVWRLEWNAVDGKFDKTPCANDGSVYRIDASLPANWNDYDTALAVVQGLPQTDVLRYALGFWLTADTGYWFLDIDKAVRADGTLEAVAAQLVTQYNGCFMEYSSSGRGVHIVGMSDNIPPKHRNKPEPTMKAALQPLELEFYHEGRGIAFGLTLIAQGDANKRADVTGLCAQYFPDRAEREETGVRADWRGPADDDVLIERFLRARLSAEAGFGGKVSLPQLWAGQCEHDSDADMALAAHLAFWTGCDELRIARLMMRSGLRREKWLERRPHGTYLSHTIHNACIGVENVYQEPQKDIVRIQTEVYGGDAPDSASLAAITAQSEVVSKEMFEKVEALIDKVTACETEFDLHNNLIPELRAAGVPLAFQEKIVAQVKRKLDLWGNKMGVAKVRALLFPPTIRGARDAALPDWAKDYCFVLNGDFFFNVQNGSQQSMVGFQAAHGKLMPITDQGRRENAAEKCLHFWNMPVVDRIGYRPDKEAFYEWDGQKYANLYSPSSVPIPSTVWTAAGIDGIDQFQKHLFDLCGRRNDVFGYVLYWMAHNVQFPGKKIRWSPIIKGVHGDGKTLMIAVLRAAMGYRNLSTTSNSNISNSGGFTDWAVRGAVNVIEEIMLTGKQRHQLYNAMKEFISNDVVDVNPKGSKPYQAYNTTNHWANTNHNDAIPMEQTDRRWLVVFTPWEDLAAMYRYCGLADEAAWRRRTESIDYAWRNCAGELRAWFLSIQIPPEFDINSSAPMTPEKMQMMASSLDDAESVAASIIEDGAVGISRNVLSSAALSTALGFKAEGGGFEVPKSTSLNHMLTRLGFSKYPRIVKWNGRTHTIWLRNGVNLENEGLRFELDKTLNPTLNPDK